MNLNDLYQRGGLKRAAKSFLRRYDLALVRYDPRYNPLARRSRLLSDHRINVVFDVGANNGGYAADLRELGYRGRIVSFEPLNDAFASLSARCARDSSWEAVQAALGDTEGSATINVAGNSESSSMLPMLPLHTEVLPSSGYVRTEVVTVTTLAHAVMKHCHDGERLFVKIDAQGFEPRIIAGGLEQIDRITGFQLEMSIMPLYEHETLMPEMVNHLKSLGYSLMSLEPGFADERTGRLLQVDGIFFREDA